MISNNILFYAFRYALGRRTYAVDDVARQIIIHKDELSEQMKNNIIREISEAEDLGMECDKKSWENVVNELT